MIIRKKMAYICAFALLSIVGIGFIIKANITKESVALDEQIAMDLRDRAEFIYTFNVDGVLGETARMYESKSPYWWVDSGAYLNISRGIGSTVKGNLKEDDKWRVTYARTNPVDTDGGYHPQNLFRLITRSTWNDLRQEVYFRIVDSNLSSSPNRNESNGLLLFNRYMDEDNLYYTGIRVDGVAVIKKKIGGVYHNLAEKKIFSGSYNRSLHPNLIPKLTWIGLRSEVETLENGAVSIRVYLDVRGNGTWTLVAEAIDDSHSYGPTFEEKSHAGIRTDFMDVEFKNYKIEEI